LLLLFIARFARDIHCGPVLIDTIARGKVCAGRSHPISRCAGAPCRNRTDGGVVRFRDGVSGSGQVERAPARGAPGAGGQRRGGSRTS
jgi:hypothetical protein